MDNIQKEQQVHILETFDGWTIDRRLKQLRKIRESDDKILFVDFDSDLGQALFDKKILVQYLNDIKKEDYKEDEDFIYDTLTTENEIVDVIQVIEKLESELK